VSIAGGMPPSKRERRWRFEGVNVLAEQTRSMQRMRTVQCSSRGLLETKHPRKLMMSMPAQGVTAVPRISKTDAGESR
jgi:hypothetical protein